MPYGNVHSWHIVSIEFNAQLFYKKHTYPNKTMINESPSIVKVTNLEELTEITQKITTTNLLIFCAEWSGSSHILLEALKENGRKLSLLLNKVMVIDFENSTELVEKYNIKEVPTTILTCDDDVVHTFSGLFSFDELADIINQNNK